MDQPKVNLPTDLDLHEGYACFHPAGEMQLGEGVGLITRTIAFCRNQGIGLLLVDATQLGGIRSPTLDERYWIARGFAFEAKNHVKVAFALQPYLLDPERFGVTVARNLGMKAYACSSREEALTWLLSETDTTPPDPLADR